MHGKLVRSRPLALCDASSGLARAGLVASSVSLVLPTMPKRRAVDDDDDDDDVDAEEEEAAAEKSAPSRKRGRNAFIDDIAVHPCSAAQAERDHR